MIGAASIKRMMIVIALTLSMLGSMLAFTTVNAQPASAHTPSCSHSSHYDWHTIYFHYDYHHLHQDSDYRYGHAHYSHNHQHGQMYTPITCSWSYHYG
jgi:hypothetical protein